MALLVYPLLGRVVAPLVAVAAMAAATSEARGHDGQPRCARRVSDEGEGHLVHPTLPGRRRLPRGNCVVEVPCPPPLPRRLARFRPRLDPDPENEPQPQLRPRPNPEPDPDPTLVLRPRPDTQP